MDRRYFLLVLCILTNFSIFSQGPDKKGPNVPEPFEEMVLQSQAVLDSLIRWEERMYLHTDRSVVAPGDYLFFRAYAMTGPNKLRVSPSGVLQVDLLDSSGALISKQYYPLKNGVASGAVEIPLRLDPNTYTVRAYTRWMQNYGSQQYFTRQIRISEGSLPTTAASRPRQVGTVSFHPEGGSLLAGLNNKLTIKSLDAHGSPVELRGQIRSLSGDVQIPVQSYGEGLAMAIFRPSHKTSYELHLENGQTYPLPEVVESGYSLQVNTLDSDRIRVTAFAVGMDREAIWLNARLGNKTILEKRLELGNSQEQKLDIPKADLPSGAMEFILADDMGHVLAERPVYVQGPEALHIELAPLKKDFSKGGENRFRLKVTDALGNPVKTDLSFSVAEEKGAVSSGIHKYMGSSAAPSDVRQLRKSRFLKDLQAISKTGVPAAVYPEEIRFPVQQGLELHAKVYNMYGELLQNTDIQIAGESDENLIIREVSSDARGVIHLTNLDVVGNTRLIFRTKEEDRLARLVRAFPVNSKAQTKERAKEEWISKYYKREQRKNPTVNSTPFVETVTDLNYDSNAREEELGIEYDTTGLIKLSEATIDGRKRQRKLNPAIHGIKPLDMNVVYQDVENPKSMSVLVQKIPGMVVMLDGGNNPIAWSNRTRANPIWVLDGEIMGRIPSTYANFEQVDDPYFDNPFYVVPSADIERIEFVYDPVNTSLFGAGAIEAGVIVVYTRSAGETRYFNRKNAGLDFQGFEPEFGFDAYLKKRKENRKLRKQPPATLYWNPAIQTDENGEALVRFASPGDYDRVRIIAETLTPEGRPGAVQMVLETGSEPSNKDK